MYLELRSHPLKFEVDVLLFHLHFLSVDVPVVVVAVVAVEVEALPYLVMLEKFHFRPLY